MTAKEMFEELGYEQSILENSKTIKGIIISYKKEITENETNLTVTCDFYEKGFFTNFANEHDGVLFIPFHISLQLNKAIQKQIEELGWDNETK